MASISNNALPFDNNAVNGDVISQTEWNQAMQAIQAAVNDNFYRVLREITVLESDGATVVSQFNLANTSGTVNNLQFEESTAITVTATQSGGNITLQFSVPSNGITAAMVGSALDTRYYTQTQVDSKINAATYTATVQAGTSFPANANSGQLFYRTDQKTLYVYDATTQAWKSPAGTASTTVVGTVLVSTAPTAGQTPVAVATTDPVYINTARTDQANTFTQAQTFDSSVTAQSLIPSGLTGATAASRYVGATTSGAPTTGTFAVGDYIIDQTGSIWICTTAGTPGTWVEIPKPSKHQSRISIARNVGGTTSTTNTPTNQMEFTFHASEWSSNIFYGEFVGSSSTSSVTLYCGIWDFTAGAAVAGSEVSTGSTSTTLLPRTGAITLTDGHVYGAYFRSSTNTAVNLDAADLLQLL